MTTCKNCGGEIADTAKFCLKCGVKQKTKIFCSNRGGNLKSAGGLENLRICLLWKNHG